MKKKANAAVRVAVEYIENTYGRPSWWNNLAQAHQDAVVASYFTMRSTAGMPAPS